VCGSALVEVDQRKGFVPRIMETKSERAIFLVIIKMVFETKYRAKIERSVERRLAR